MIKKYIYGQKENKSEAGSINLKGKASREKEEVRIERKKKVSERIIAE